tara:strand:- start:542 stop:1465 length:924 start_codon:yes stop_codon:yes gene_type:complete
VGEALSDLATAHLIALAGISILAGLIQGSLGFGFAIVSVPLLVLLDERLAPVPQILAALPLSILVWWRERAHTEVRAVVLMSLGRLPGTFLGHALLGVASAAVLDVTIGSLVLFAVVVLAVGRAVPRNPTTETVAGLLSGTAGYVSAISGPPIALLYKGAPGATARATISLILVVGSVITLSGRFMGGRFTELDLWLGAVALPSTLLGLWLSGFVKDRIEGRPMQLGILALCTLAGVALLGRAGTRMAAPPTPLDDATEVARSFDPIRRAARSTRSPIGRRVGGGLGSGRVRAAPSAPSRPARPVGP